MVKNCQKTPVLIKRSGYVGDELPANKCGYINPFLISIK
jgi:hypothetical protein